MWVDYWGGGGGGVQRVCWPPSQTIGGGAAAPCPPFSYAYVIDTESNSYNKYKSPSAHPSRDIKSNKKDNDQELIQIPHPTLKTKTERNTHNN